jgi:hypothetical protein
LEAARGCGAEGESGGETAGEGVRTLDIQLGKLTLYQLSYARNITALILASGPQTSKGIVDEGIRGKRQSTEGGGERTGNSRPLVLNYRIDFDVDRGMTFFHTRLTYRLATKARKMAMRRPVMG